MLFSLVLLSFNVCPKAEALVYRCIHPDTGAVTYQDFACEILNPLNRTLPIDYAPTPKAYLAKARAQTVQKAHRDALRQQKKLDRDNKRAETARLKAEKRDAWYQARCESAQTQKAELQNRLHQGYTAKSETRLRQRLKQAEQKVIKYCVKPSS